MIDAGRGGRLGAGIDAAVERRIPVLALGIIAVFCVFLVRLFQLQILEGDDLRRRSQSNSVRTLRLEAPRGDILDRHGREIATTRLAFGVQLMPIEVRHPERTFAALGMLLGRDPHELQESFGEPRGRGRFQPVRLAGDISLDDRARVESHRFALSGVVADERPRREYVGGDVAAHLMGYLGEIRRDQLETRSFADYRQGDVIGQSGVESRLEHELRGRDGGQNVVVDVAGRVLGEPLEKIEPVHGNQVMLSIDFELQKAAVAGFQPEVLGDREKMGALVALDPRNGDVLALVSRPAFDPNDFAGGVDAETWDRLVNDEWKPLQNRAISGQYPPGSTYKAFVAAAALQEGLVDSSDREFCHGHFRLGRRSYRCWKKGGHGAVDMHVAIVRSCDVYFYITGLKLGVDRLAYYARGFNLGRLSDVPLPQEKPGLVPTSWWKERRFGEPWMRGETVSVSIGQGFNLTTPLQLALAYAAIANGGQIVQPRLLLRVERADGTVDGPPPQVRGQVPVDPAHLALVREALRGVVNEPGGTGGRSRLPDVEVAGKTGTSQVVRLKHTEHLEDDEVPIRFRDHAWFAAFAPYDDPEIVAVALVEHGGHGGSAAAPIVRRVLEKYFEGKEQPLIETDVAYIESPSPFEEFHLAGR